MAFNFPNTPADGALYVPLAGGPAYTWSAASGAWKLVSGGINAGVYISDTPPAAPLPGQLWWESDTGNTFIWFNDGNSSQWVQFNASAPLLPYAPLNALSRNLFVNPCAHVSQELGSAAQTTTGVFIADQWQISFTGAGAAISAKSDNAIVNPSGSLMRLLFKTTTAKVSLAAGDFAGIGQRLEGNRISPLGYTGNTPVQALLRFNFNGPAGTYSVSIRNPSALTVSWIGQFTITAAQANTDTTQLLVIPPPPSGYVWATGTAAQVELWFGLACGTTYTAPGLGWQAGNFLAGPGQSNLLDTVNKQAALWDFGFYADPNKTGIPPPFQVPDHGTDLIECQRYFELVLTTGVPATGGSWPFPNTPYRVVKRTTATVAIVSGAASGATFVSTGAYSLQQNAPSTAVANLSISNNARM